MISASPAAHPNTIVRAPTLWTPIFAQSEWIFQEQHKSPGPVDSPGKPGSGAFCTGSGTVAHEYRLLIEASPDSMLDPVFEGRLAPCGRTDG